MNASGFRRPDHTLEIEGVHRFSLPVRNLAKAELFYTQVLGGDIVERNAIEMGRWESPGVRLQMCSGVEVVLVEQGYGWLPIDSTNPHWGFAIPGADVDTWVEHLEEWRVPSALVFRDHYVVENGVPTRVELHFLDPDGNQIELVAWDYPMNDQAWRGRYDPWPLYYSYASWPPQD